MSFEEEIGLLLEKAKCNVVFSDNLVWNVLTALRGPDSDNDELKDLTTRRLRYMVFPHGLVGLNREEPLSTKEVLHRNQLLENDKFHFKYHFQDALRAAKYLGYDVPDNELSFEIAV